MSKLEMILEKINPKKAILTGLLFTSLILGCKKDSPVQAPAPKPNKAPITRIIIPVNNSIYNSNSVNAQWSGSDEDGRVIGYSVVLDNGAFSDFATNYTSKTFSNLSNGIHTLKVTARDNNNANDPNPPQVNFTVSADIVGPVDNTNAQGYTKIELGTNIFHVYVKNLSNQPLNNIKVSGVDYGLIQGFLAEDFSLNYLSEIYYTGGYGLGKSAITVVDTPKIFLRAKANNEARARKLPNLKNNQNIENLGVSSFSDIKSFYQEYDIITNLLGISYVEYLLNNTSKKFAFPIRAAKFRQDIIDNAENYGKIVNQITSLVEKEWDADALYLDVWRPKTISVLSHYFSEDKLCTLKGKVTDINNQPINGVRVSVGNLYDDTDQNGEYIIKSYKHVKRNIEKFLREGNYTVTASATNYNTENKNINLVAATPQDPMNPYIASNILNFKLQPKSSGPQTIIIQPGLSDGKDAAVAVIRHPQNPCFFYCNDNYGNDQLMYIERRRQSNNTEHYYHSFLQFDLSQIPSNATISSAKLYVYGDPYSSTNSPTNISISSKEVLSSWSESTITWNNQPTLGTTLDTKVISYNGDTSDPTNYLESWDITNLVKQWYSGQKLNYGICLTANYEAGEVYCGFEIKSSEHTDSAKRPKLTIIYTK